MQEPQQKRKQQASSEVRCFAFRLVPGEDLVQGVRSFVAAHHLRAVAVVTCVGSLTRVTLRFANAEKWVEKRGPFEILSLAGTVDEHGEHLHIGLADSRGRCIGGHFGTGSNVYTTVEIVLAELTALEFRRMPCSLSGYDELKVTSRKQAPGGKRR